MNFLNPILCGIAIHIFFFINRLRGRKRVLVYTDSRGFEVTRARNRRNVFSSYVGELIKTHACVVKLCPEKSTTLVDFLFYAESVSLTQFDYVVLHCGIVDFAPRPLSSFTKIYSKKKNKLASLGIEPKRLDPKGRLSMEFEGEPTVSFLTSEVLIEEIIPRLQNITGLVYIGVNRVVPGWRGAYWRDRPKNINDQLALDACLLNNLPQSIDLQSWTEDQIKCYTTDNVHYSQAGFDWISNRIKYVLKS